MSSNFYHPSNTPKCSKKARKAEQKAKLRIASRLSIIIIAIFTTIAGSLQAFAAITPEGAIKTTSELEKRAETMLIARAFQKCMDYIHVVGAFSSGTYNDIYRDDGGFLNNAKGTGVWLEKQTQGEVDNGSIYCNQGENLPDLLASHMGISKDKILCDGNGSPGVIAAVKGNMWSGYDTVDYDCGSDPNGDHAKAPGANEHIEKLWNDFANANGFPLWGDIDKYDEDHRSVDPTEDKTGYMIYPLTYKEYKTFCGANTQIGEDTKDDTYVGGNYSHLNGIPIIDETGGVRYHWVKDIEDDTIETTFIKNWGGATCGFLVDKMREFFPYYQRRIQQIVRDECPTLMKPETDKIRDEANEILNNADSTDKQKEKAQKKIDEIDAAEAAGFVETSSTGGLQCTEVQGVSVSIEDTDIDGATDEDDGDDPDACYANAGALGWILCPVIKSVDGILGNLYDAIEAHFLKIEINDAFTDGSPTYNAWNIIRNIANVAFVAMLLLVILSQLTGFGIDNYGIKRTLPRIIIAAILVNLSFILCQLCIDLSNIIGISLRSMLENLAPSGAGSSLNGLAFAGSVTLTAGIGIGVGFLIAHFSASGWVGVVLMLLLAVIAILIAALFLFILLIARQAALIMLVVIAPLGLVCYMLPNTERLFKKWIDAMKGLLMLYPICSVVIGGGVFAGAVLSKVGSGIGADGWVYSLAAMLIQVVPYFFIPKLLRGSLSAIGGIGDQISNLGTRLRRGATGAVGRGIRNTERYKGRVARRTGARHDRYLDRQMQRELDPNRRSIQFRGRTIRRGSLMNQIAERDPTTGDILRNSDGSVRINDDRLNNLSTSERRQLMEAQARQRDNLTQGARIVSGHARLSDSSIDAQRAQYRAADLAQEVKDQEALISNEKGAADGNNVDYLTEQLAQELGKADQEVNASRIRALTNMLSRNGDSGRQGVRDAMLTAEQRASASGGNIGDEARQAYTQNIMSNWAADYKNNQRSVYDYAKGNTGASAGNSLAAGIADAVNSVKQEQLASMDEAELGAYVERLNAAATTSGGVAGTAEVEFKTGQKDASGNDIKLKQEVNGFSFEDANKIRSIARDTLANEQLTKDMKLSQKEQIARLAGYSSAEEAVAEIRKQNNMQTVNIGGSDYQVHRVPDGFANASVDIKNGQVIYSNSDGSTFNATTNSIDLHPGSGSGSGGSGGGP